MSFENTPDSGAFKIMPADHWVIADAGKEIARFRSSDDIAAFVIAAVRLADATEEWNDAECSARSGDAWVASEKMLEALAAMRASQDQHSVQALRRAEMRQEFHCIQCGKTWLDETDRHIFGKVGLVCDTACARAYREDLLEVHILHEKGDGKACDPLCGFTTRQRLTLVATPPIKIDESVIKLPKDIGSW